MLPSSADRAPGMGDFLWFAKNPYKVLRSDYFHSAKASQTKKMPVSRDQVVGLRGNCAIEHEIVGRVFLHNVMVLVWRLPLSNGCEFCDRIPYVLSTQPEMRPPEHFL